MPPSYCLHTNQNVTVNLPSSRLGSVLSSAYDIMQVMRNTSEYVTKNGSCCLWLKWEIIRTFVLQKLFPLTREKSSVGSKKIFKSPVTAKIDIKVTITLQVVCNAGAATFITARYCRGSCTELTIVKVRRRVDGD